MKIKWYGHSCFLLTDSNGSTVLTDPCDPSYGYIFIYLFYIFKFNDLYIAKSKFNVQKVIKNNPGKTKEELGEICKKKGKNSYLLALLSLVAFLLLVFL